MKLYDVEQKAQNIVDAQEKVEVDYTIGFLTSKFKKYILLIKKQ